MGAEDTKGLTGTSSSAPSAPPQPNPNPNPNHYGTFQGVAYTTHPTPNHTVIGIPPPPAAAPSPYYYPPGYHSTPGYVISEVRPLREDALCCCGLGLGWILFISGIFFAAMPWYIGALILLCGRVDYREKPGLVACMIASILTVIAIVFGAAGGAESW